MKATKALGYENHRREECADGDRIKAVRNGLFPPLCDSSMTSSAASFCRLERDHEFERQAMQCSEVELVIRNAAHSGKLRKKLKVSFNAENNPVFCNGQVLVKPADHFISMPSLVEMRPFYPQPECEPTILHHGQRILNGDMRLRAKFIFLRLSYIDELANSVISPLEENCSWVQKDIDQGAYLGEAWGITGDWNATTAPKHGEWAYLPRREHNIPELSSGYIRVRNAKNVISYSLQIFLLAGNKYAVLPVSYYQNTRYKQPLKLFIFPPVRKYTLLNAHRLREYPNATVYLVNDIIAALASPPSNESIYLANVGGDAWIDNLDIEPLRNRKVVCPALKKANETPTRKSLQSALNLANCLSTIGVSPEFSLLNIGFL